MKLKTLKLWGKIGKEIHRFLSVINLVTSLIFRALIALAVVLYATEIGIQFNLIGILGCYFFVFWPLEAVYIN